MKKRILVLVLLLVLALALFACGDATPDECEHAWGKWIGTSEGHYHVCAKCGEQSKVFNHNCEDDTDIVGTDYVAKCKLCGYMVHTAIYPTIEAKDEAQNATYLAEINQALKELDEKGLSSDISAKMTIRLNRTIVSDLDFSCKNSDDLYFVLRGADTVIYQEEDGKIFSYAKDSIYDYKRKYVCDVDEFLIPSESLGGVDVEDSIELDTSKCNISKDGSKYIIEAYATDMMGEEITAQLEELYKELGLDSAILSKLVVKTQFEISQTRYEYTMDMTLVMSVEGQIIEIPYEITMSIEYSEIEKIDFLNGEYKLSPPSCIEEVMTISNATDTFKTGQYYAVQLEEGQYYALFKYENSNYGNPNYTSSYSRLYIYDDKGIELKTLDSEECKFYSYNFVVPTDGLYYMTFEYANSYIGKLIRCDYETSFDVDNPKPFTLNVNGVLEGLYDVENYAYTSECDKLLVIKNTSDMAICVSVNGETVYIESGEDALAIINKGDNQIIVTAQNITEKTNYSLECKELSNPNGTDMSNLEVLSEDWSGDYLLANNFSKKFAKIHVEESGYYSIELQATPIYGNMVSSYYIGKGFYEDNYYYSCNGKILEKGDYIVWIELHWVYDDIALNVNLKYTFHSLEDKDIDVELPVCNNSETIEDIAIDSQRYDSNQIVKYKFSLNESSIIKYYSRWYSEVVIYDESGKQLTPIMDVNDYSYIKLPAGNYYCTSDAMNPKGDKVMIFVVTDYTGTYIDYENMPTIQQDTPYTIDFEQGTEYYFKIKIEKDGTYRFPVCFADNNEQTNDYSTRIYLFDANMQKVKRRDIAMHMFDISAGDYYVVVRSLDNKEKARGYIITLEDVTN